MKKKQLLIFVMLVCINNLFAQNIDSLYDSGKEYLKQQQFSQAYSIIDRIFEIDKDSPIGYNLLGHYFNDRANIDSAMFCYTKANELDSTYSAPYYNLGNCYSRYGDYPSALYMYKKAVKFSEGDTDALLLTGFTYGVLEEPDSAFYYYQLALEADSTNADVYYYRCHLYSNYYQYENALSDVEQAITIDSTNANYHSKYGSLLLDIGEYASSISAFEKSMEIDSTSSETRLNLAVAYLNNGEYEQAWQNISYLYNLYPDREDVILLACQNFYYWGNIEKCFEFAKIGLELFPDSEQFNNMMGLAYFYNLDYENAEIHFENAISKNPQSIESHQNFVSVKLLKNTSPEVLIKGNNVIFKEIFSARINELDEWVADKKHKYYYKTLFEKYNKNYADLSYDEYFMFYYGYTTHKTYSPYSINLELKELNIDNLLDQNKYAEVITTCTTYLQKNPTSIQAIFYIALCGYNTADYTLFREYYFKYKAFISAIRATGAGTDYINANIVTSTADEYIIANYLGYNVAGQALQENYGHSFDVLNLENETGNQTTFYFNIDKPFNFLNTTFSDKKWWQFWKE